MSCFYVAVDFFTEENAKKAFEFCKENFEWFVEGDGDSAGFELSGTKITDAVDSNGEGLDSDEFDALSEANWLKELSENGFDFKAQIVFDSSDISNDNNDILECESKDRKFNSQRYSFMYDNGWGFDIIDNPHDGFKPCNDIWSQEPVEMTLIFKCKKTGKKYKYVSECSIGADTFDEIMDDDYNLECGCFTLTPDGSDSWTLEEIDFDNLHYSKEFVPIDGGKILDDDVDEYDFDEEFELVYAETGCESPASITIPEDDTLKIPEGATEIEDNAFKNNASLTNAIIPKGITKIGNDAFAGCKSLVSVTIPEGVTEIGGFAFFDCKSLASVTIPETVTEINVGAFSGCKSLVSVTIPKGVTMIGDSAFKDCKSLASVTIPEGVTKIGSYAFQDCKTLASVTIPESVTEIGSYAFQDCKILASVIISEGVTKIGNSAFNGCKSLTSVTIPKTVTKIYFKAFSGCESLASMTIPETVTEIYPEAFSNCKSLASVTIPEGVTEIYSATFFNCKSLVSVTIPETVTKIGYKAFSGCESLASVTIPEGVTEIDDSAFSSCESLASVIFTGTKQQWEDLDRCIPSSVKTIKCSDGTIER